MAEEAAGRGRGTRIAAGLAIVVAVLLALRLLGPGGGGEGSAPSPPPPTSAPAPADAPPVAVGGRVLRADGAPVEGAFVEVGFSGTGGGPYERRRAGPTGPDGRFSFPGLPSRRSALHLRARLGALAAEADLAGAPGALDIDLRLPVVATISGMILAAEDGRPLADMEVSLGDRSAKTDPLGRFALLDVPPALLEGEDAVLVVRGAGRRERRHPLGAHGALDDLLLRVEREAGR